MWVRGLVAVIALVVASCANPADAEVVSDQANTRSEVSLSSDRLESAPAESPSTSPVPSAPAESAETPATPQSEPPTPQPDSFSWPEADGSPRWTTTALGLPGTTHVQVTHGPLGFLSVNNVSRGAVVRTSADGVAWTETAVLEGPGGQEQVSIVDMVVTENEYLLTGETWTNSAGGSESFHNVLWRSPDAVAWTLTQLDELVPNAQVARLVAATPGLVLAGMVQNRETGIATPGLWLDQAGEWVDLSAAIPGFEERGWIDGAVAIGDGMVLWGSRDGATFVWLTADFETWHRGVVGEDSSHIGQVAMVGDGWVAAGSRGTWLSDDAVNWRLGAAAEDFATDAVSEGTAEFGRLFVQDG